MLDLAAYALILSEPFAAVPEIPGGLWRGRHRWDDLIFNSELSFHSYPGLSLPGTPALDLQPFQVEDGILSIVPAPIPEGRRADVETVLRVSGATAGEIAQVTHYTGLLSLHDSWAETYGYVEIRARLPGAVGYWPAFWLAPGTKGWPPEIDVFETDGRNRSGPLVTTFEATLHFDGYGPAGQALPNPAPGNSYRTSYDGLGSERLQQPVERPGPRGPRWTLGATVDAEAVPGGGILSEEFHVWGLEWTPNEIVWWFGKTADAMTEVYRTPTPPDLHSPLYVIANVEVGGLLAGAVDAGGPDPDRLEIDYIEVYARQPDNMIFGAGMLRGTDGPDWLIGGSGDDVFRPGGGFDMIETGAGRDVIHLARGDGNTVIEDFSPQDRLVLSGYFRTAADLHVQALQVGTDLWLRDPGHPFEPRTLILRGVDKASFLSDQIVDEPSE